jgi:cytochrome c553
VNRLAQLAALAAGLAGAAVARAQTPSPEEINFFEKRIRPLLAQHCYECHSHAAKKLKGNLLLDSRQGWARGGDSGPAVVPGNPDASRLIMAVRYTDADLQMPPSGKLSDEDVAALSEWVKRGAPDPRDEAAPPPSRARSPDIEAGRSFWSFRPPADPPVPRPRSDDWAATDIDRFVLARLESAGLAPGPDADRATLARRLTFDLTGLPPTPEEVEAFVRDTGADALDRLIDRLLASPRYGEHWGRRWLDVARFAESSGGGRSLMFKNAWRYRDYVVESFNADKPFARFVLEQVAGDLLPFDSPAERNANLTATGFLMLGAINYEEQDKELLRMDVIDEQIETVGRAFMGLTLGCARCHDHKFDPIPTTDYYGLAGIFRSTQFLTPGNVSGFVEQELALPEPKAGAWKAHRAAVEALTAKLEQARAEQRASKAGGGKAAARRNPTAADLTGVVVDDAEATLVGDWLFSTYEKGYVGKGYLHDKNEGKGEKSATFVPYLPRAGRYEVRLWFTPGTNRATNVPVRVDHLDGQTPVKVNQREAGPIDGWSIALGRFRFAEGSDAVVTVSTEGTDGHVIIDAVQFVPEEEIAAAPPPAGAPADRVKALERELKELEARAPEKPPTAMALQDEPKPGDWHVHVRGEAHNLGPKVPRGFVSVLTRDRPQIPAERSGRLELARWIASPDHPMAARVYVNRVWQHLLGVGLVATSDNLGMAGESPSHPELLDFLARQFVRDGGSTRTLIRHIVRSRVYRLATGLPDPRDPENRLLSRARRRPLEAEAIRDAILSVSGQLDLTAGGLTIEKFAEYDYGIAVESRRRSVYVPRFRNSMVELFELFDAATPNVSTSRRAESTVPTQALFWMNNSWVRRQARDAAERLLAEEGFAPTARLERAFRRALGRGPTSDEANLCNERLKSYDGGEPAEAWADLFQALFSCVDFRYLE